jgi:allantoinase
MPYDLLIRRGQLVSSEGVRQGDIAVQDGRIADIAPEISGNAGEEIDAAGLHVFPGLIDMHVHFNEPGREAWEGVASGSRALAAGGGTLYADMPLNSHPPLLTGHDLRAKRAAAERSSITDFALWGGLTPDNIDHLPELAEGGVVGFKAFMSSSGIPEFRPADDLTLYRGMQVVAELNLPVAVHAESEAITSALAREIRERGGNSVTDYLASRPVVAELEAISRALLLAAETGADLHIVHVSTARGVMLVKEARERGVKASCETCPHYLAFSDEDMERLGAILKCAPPLRSQDERLALWKVLKHGEIDLVASDHSPAPPELKEGDDFFDVWGGISGVQATLAALLEGGLAPERIAKFTAEAPAERFRLKGKGRSAPGFDADLALVDLNATYTLSADALLTRHKLSPYLGRTFRGVVRQTFLRGRAVFEDGKIVGESMGQLVHPNGR